MNLVSLQSAKEFFQMTQASVGSFLGKAVVVISTNPIPVVATVIGLALVVFGTISYYKYQNHSNDVLASQDESKPTIPNHVNNESVPTIPNIENTPITRKPNSKTRKGWTSVPLDAIFEIKGPQSSSKIPKLSDFQ